MAIGSERFSGHESFVCRYGWLPKVYSAVTSNPKIFRNEELAMLTLGIGRNMVKSLQFWAEAAGIIATDANGGHSSGYLGTYLFSEERDPYLESPESLWLIHWHLSTHAGLAAWNEVFGEGRLIRFERTRLVTSLVNRSSGLTRQLARSTLEQHASLFIQSYYQSERNADDTSWCPLQSLGLIKATKTENGAIYYSTDINAQVGLSTRTFALALVDFLLRQQQGCSADFRSVLKGNYSPGFVFRLNEHQLRQYIENAMVGPLQESLRFVDTADTQNLVLTPSKLDPQFNMWPQVEALAHA